MSGALDLRSFAHYSSVRLANIIGSRVSQTLPSFPAWLNILPGPELKAIKQVVTSSRLGTPTSRRYQLIKTLIVRGTVRIVKLSPADWVW